MGRRGCGDPVGLHRGTADHRHQRKRCQHDSGQHAAGGTINSFLHCYGKATYAFEFWTNSGTAVTTVAAGAAASKWVRIRVDGT
ncbi:MAG: hypothetical protein EBX99_08300, partial [Acidimicrobiia bacterium]|nr:hypothetical protein [Acidimicrobiia bacterium]